MPPRPHTWEQSSSSSGIAIPPWKRQREIQQQQELEYKRLSWKELAELENEKIQLRKFRFAQEKKMPKSPKKGKGAGLQLRADSDSEPNRPEEEQRQIQAEEDAKAFAANPYAREAADSSANDLIAEDELVSVSPAKDVCRIATVQDYEAYSEGMIGWVQDYEAYSESLWPPEFPTACLEPAEDKGAIVTKCPQLISLCKCPPPPPPRDGWKEDYWERPALPPSPVANIIAGLNHSGATDSSA